MPPIVPEPGIDLITPDLPVGSLLFDTQNPRLEDGIDGNDPKTDQEVILSLRDVGALKELIASITANGFKKIEPLVIHGPDGGPYTVLEGNRRLACIKLLRDPALADECGIAVPNPVPQYVKDSIETVSVYRVATPSDARAFIGFKHINGPHRWESFAKAKYVTKWWKESRSQGVLVNDIASMLGDDNNTIRNMIAGMLVLEQAQSIGFDIQDRANRGRFAFSHLYTALSRLEYTEFLGLSRGWSQTLADSPVPAPFVPQLEEVMLWLYGSKSRSKSAMIKSQNPDLADLGDALKHPVALSVLRAGKSLAEARLEFRPPGALLNESLVELNLKMRETVQLAGRSADVPVALVEIGREVATQARSLSTLLEANQVAPAVGVGTGIPAV